MTTFKGFEKVAKCDNADRDCEFIIFKGWEKNGKKRTYLNDYKRRTIGYIDQSNNGNFVVYDRQGNTAEEIEYAMNQFKSQFAF